MATLVSFTLTAQPLHWNYDLSKLDAVIGGREDLEFWHPSANPYYSIETGQQSCYGDQALVILKSIVECKSKNQPFICVIKQI